MAIEYPISASRRFHNGASSSLKAHEDIKLTRCGLRTPQGNSPPLARSARARGLSHEADRT